ncbi:MAG: single-stranded DNA-binding protein [Paracoccaceae bacterium]|nr:single-stranded DNA-binding protein [Paracoccaceae bacterium]
MFHTYAEFRTQGYVGKITALGKALKIAVADTQKWTDRQTGEKREKTNWNTLTLFDSAAAFDWVKGNLKVGDLVYATGTLAETSYEKDGVTQYGVTLRAETVAVVPTGKGE